MNAKKRGPRESGPLFKPSMKLLLIFLQKLPRLLYLIVRCINNLVCALQPHSLRNLLCLGCLIL